MAIVRRKTSKEMTTFLKAKRNGRLLGSVERHILSTPEPPRRWDILHPSAICKEGWCPRAAWYVVTSPTPPPAERLNRRSAAIFGEGNTIHAKYQGWFREMGVLYGEWECLVCHRRWEGFDDDCVAACEPQIVKYREVPLENPDWLIAGHADGWIKGIDDDALIEIKSVGTGTVRIEAPNMFNDYEGDLDEIWRNLKRPFSSHLKQAQLYLRVLHATRDDAPDEVVFIYECKSNQDAKEFVVPYDEGFTDHIITKALLVKKHTDLGTPPPCPTGGCHECQPYDRKQTA